MAIHFEELRTHTWQIFSGIVIAGGSAFGLREISQLGVKGFATSLVKERLGFTENGKLAYVLVAYNIYQIADKIFHRLGWQEELPRGIASVVIGGISGFSLTLAARHHPIAAYLVTGLTALQLGLWTILGVCLISEGLKGTIHACSSDSTPAIS